MVLGAAAKDTHERVELRLGARVNGDGGCAGAGGAALVVVVVASEAGEVFDSVCAARAQPQHGVHCRAVRAGGDGEHTPRARALSEDDGHGRLVHLGTSGDERKPGAAT